jgi:nucleoid-associated protein YgaU
VTAASDLLEEPQLLDSEAVASAEPMQRSALDDLPAATAAAFVPVPTGHAPRHEVTRYVAAVGDSWWSLAERMYGDGRYYRALFAWNRAVNPRVSLVPGTPLELPPLSKLAVAWPALVPDE